MYHVASFSQDPHYPRYGRLWVSGQVRHKLVRTVAQNNESIVFFIIETTRIMLFSRFGFANAQPEMGLC